jgi:hypothetical protein
VADDVVEDGVVALAGAVRAALELDEWAETRCDTVDGASGRADFEHELVAAHDARAQVRRQFDVQRIAGEFELRRCEVCGQIQDSRRCSDRHDASR